MVSSQMTARRKARRINADINITPLVDVMLVLLVIFMVTAPMLTSSIQLNLPEANTKASNEQQDSIIISIDAASKIYLAGKEVRREYLINELQAITGGDLQRKLFIEGDKDLAYAVIVKIIASLNQAGFTKVVLVTKVRNEE